MGEDIRKFRIVNWERRYLKGSRKGKHNFWCKLPADEYCYKGLNRCSMTARVVYSYLLQECTSLGQSACYVRTKCVVDALHARTKRVLSAYLELLEIGVIVEESDFRCTKERKRERKKTDDTTSDAPYVAELDFDALYQQYPRKVGKAQFFQRCQSQIKTKERYDELSLAIKNYAAFVANQEQRFIKHASSFMNPNVWVDWISPQQENNRELYGWEAAELLKQQNGEHNDK